MKINKIYDFFVRLLSKNLRREIWLELCALFYKGVNAKILEELCGCVNPSYSDLINRVERAVGLGHLLREGELVSLFYDDRESFLTDIMKLLNEHVPSARAISLYEELRAIYALIPDRFAEIVRENKLTGKVKLLNTNDMGVVLEFTKIKVKGKVHFSLGGIANRWSFRRVKFLDSVIVSLYPSFFINYSPMMTFQNNICRSSFACLFAFADNIAIIGNKFKLPVLVEAAINSVSENKQAVAQWKGDMIDIDISYFSANSTVEFSSNYFNHIVRLDNNIGEYPAASIKMVRFGGGNIIRGVSVPDPKLSKIKARSRFVPYRPSPKGKPIVSDVRFGINEHITTPDKREALLYKDFFIALKNEAIKKHDREAEFNYGRQERYFDWCLADRLQDKFIVLWSRIMSNSGISWLRPASILLGGQYALAAFFIGWLGGCCDYAAWFQAAVESLNPLSSLPDMLESLGGESCKCSLSAWEDSISASIYNAVRRIFSLALIYEIVKALRRFSN